MSELERNILGAINSRFEIVWSDSLSKEERSLCLNEWTIIIVKQITQLVLDNPLDHKKYSQFFHYREGSPCLDNLIMATKHVQVLSVTRVNKKASFFARVSTLRELKEKVDECFELHPNHVDKKIKFRAEGRPSANMNLFFVDDSEEGDVIIFK